MPDEPPPRRTAADRVTDLRLDIIEKRMTEFESRMTEEMREIKREQMRITERLMAMAISIAVIPDIRSTLSWVLRLSVGSLSGLGITVIGATIAAVWIGSTQ